MNKFLFLLGITVVLALVWALHWQSQQTLKGKAELARVTKEKTDALTLAEHNGGEVTRLEALLTQTQNLVANAAPEADRPFENALEAWIGKVKKLAAYLNQHPEKRIPHMESLTTEEWLDVTKDKDFGTEADYRRALGTLRGAVRRKAAGDVANTLRQAIAANNGTIPTSLEALAPYLPAGANPALLQTLELNPSGEISGLKTKQPFYFVDKPVDLWDATIFYSNDGNWGSCGSVAAGEYAVKGAITQFTQANGYAPTDPLQLLQYLGIRDISESNLQELLKALTTRM